MTLNMSTSASPSTRAASEVPVQGAQTNWSLVDQAVSSLVDLDIVEMANHVVTQARVKGPKEAFNEAGTVRYQLAKVRKQVTYLNETICSESIEAQKQRIRALERANGQKRLLTAEASEDTMQD